MDAAASRLRDVLALSLEVGAAAMLLDEILRQRGPEAPDANIELLLRSVAAEPTWSLNRVRLARAYVARGDIAAARASLDAAIANMIDPDTPADPLTESFDALFTGRRAVRRRVIDERAELG
jgi:hypothetical protein